MKRRYIPGTILAIILLLTVNGLALAHATLRQALPLPDGVLGKPPARIELQFSEEVEAQFGAIAVYNQNGVRVDTGDAALDPKDVTRVIASLKPVSDGLYTVAWRVVSADGHPISGTYGFSVGQGIAGAKYYKPEVPDPNGPPPLPLLVGYWLAVGGLMALAGLGGMRAAVVRLAPDRRYAVWVAGAVAAALAGTLLYLVARTAQAAGVSLATALNPSLLMRMISTRTGAAVGERLVILALTACLAPWLARRWWFAAGAGALGLLTVSMGGHAIAINQPLLGVSLDWLHLMAASVWAGGVLQLALLVPGGLSGAELGAMVRRFSPLAAVSIAVLIGTGLYPALLHIPSLEALEQTAYGVSLMVKLALIVPLLLLGAFNLLVVGPRLRKGAAVGRWLRWASGAETALMAVVVGVAVLLTNLPPARVALPPKILDVQIHS
ncbi:MAG: copper resistance protein CopC, partial [Firmicutes bacterium]|nr:copper resistance protein CopC [Bacillota bacterium]